MLGNREAHGPVACLPQKLSRAASKATAKNEENATLNSEPERPLCLSSHCRQRAYSESTASDDVEEVQ